MHDAHRTLSIPYGINQQQTEIIIQYVYTPTSNSTKHIGLINF